MIWTSVTIIILKHLISLPVEFIAMTQCLKSVDSLPFPKTLKEVIHFVTSMMEARQDDVH